MKKTSFLLFFLFFAAQNLAQEVYTEFTNPSFEDTPRPQISPSGWQNCGFEGETPTDIHPGGFFNVNTKAYHGNTYLGMVARGNNTWESVGQKLEIPLVKSECYSFNLFMCMSPTYVSSIKPNLDKQVDFTEPIILRVWGGNKFCDQKELLGVSKLVDHVDWENYEFVFSPKEEVTYLVLEAYFENTFITPNGNILLDNLSPVYILNCDDLESSLLYHPTTLTPEKKLRNTVNHYGGDILFKSKNKLTSKAKDALRKIQEAFASTQNSKVIFCIRGKKTKKVAARIETLESFLKKIGFKEKTFSIIPNDSYHESLIWTFRNSDIYINLQKSN